MSRYEDMCKCAEEAAYKRGYEKGKADAAAIFATQRKQVKVLYECDRHACYECKEPKCQHTSDIMHAKHFAPAKNPLDPCFMEIIHE